jgi:hypothetical protein
MGCWAEFQAVLGRHVFGPVGMGRQCSGIGDFARHKIHQGRASGGREGSGGGGGLIVAVRNLHWF